MSNLWTLVTSKRITSATNSGLTITTAMNNSAQATSATTIKRAFAKNAGAVTAQAPALSGEQTAIGTVGTGTLLIATPKITMRSAGGILAMLRALKAVTWSSALSTTRSLAARCTLKPTAVGTRNSAPAITGTLMTPLRTVPWRLAPSGLMTTSASKKRATRAGA